MSEKIRRISEGILEGVGGKENLQSITHCMTRVRVTLRDYGKYDKGKLENSFGVMGVVESNEQIQIIVGPSTATKVTKTLGEITGIEEDTLELGNAAAVKQQVTTKYKAPFSDLLKKIANIFIPLIPAFIGSGLIMGINNIVKKFELISNANIVGLLGIFAAAVFSYMAIMVGVNAAKEFGGSPAIGGLMAGILISPGLADIILFEKNLVPGRGGIIAVLLVVIFASFVERKFRELVPESLELIITPVLTILISGFVAVVVLQPIGGVISDVIGAAVTGAIENGGALIGAALAGTFLPLVMTGLHQGLTPIHADLLAKTGVNTLLPILAMAGCGQVGAAIAVYVKTKNIKIKKTIASALPVGILGIGEPLIYGVTLPLGKPFLGACIGGAAGGAVIAIFNVGSISMGLSGLPLATLIQSSQILLYLIGVLSAYAVGFAATYFLGFKDPENYDV
ncbi:PTS system sucrose-specific IIC component [Anaerosolibacter carboniphilus]|uniref:PTS system sucrose-specific IIC component n=1 Tax=Anaerosolibacter carboniphilus TaxID=1417629 RepID=A0A841KZG2_9FIRM|nr:PTS system sucrose-specific IIC component [Anaerosolibacter carboniphilus]